MKSSQEVRRVALYARVSSEEQREGQTIDSQVAELERYAGQQGWSIAETYKDNGWSGGLLARPELDRLRDDASAHQFDGVLVNDVDRLARDVAHLGVIRRSFERSGVALLFRKLPSENTPTRNLMVNILGSFAEFERELIADRTRRGRRHKTETRKQFIGCLPPYGYAYVEKAASGGKGRLQVNQQEAIIVKRIYEWVDTEGLSAQAIVHRLNHSGLKPRKGANSWAKTTVRRILRSQTYSGIWHYNKHESFEPLNRAHANRYRRTVKTSLRLRDRADWIAVPLPKELWLIARDRWERVQRRIDQNIPFSRRNSRHSYLLRGLVRCAGCGARFIGDPGHGHFSYRCFQRCKKVGMVVESDLNKAVWNAVETAILNPSLIAKSLVHLSRKNGQPSEVQQITTETAKKLGEQLDSEESRILEAYRLTVISPEQLERELKALKARRTALHEQMASFGNAKETTRLSEGEVQSRISDFCRLIESRLGKMNVEEKQRVLRLVVNEIIFDGQSVQIRAVIPANQDAEETGGARWPLDWKPSARTIQEQPNGPTLASGQGRQNRPNESGIEDTTPHLRVRNLDLSAETKSTPAIPFMLTAKVDRDQTKRRTASLINLRKASFMRWARRRRGGDASSHSNA